MSFWFQKTSEQWTRLRLIYARRQTAKGSKSGDVMPGPPKVKKQEPVVSDGESDIANVVKVEEAGASGLRLALKIIAFGGNYINRPALG